MIKRREFLRRGGLGAAALGSSWIATRSVPAFAKKKPFRWRLVMAIPKTLPIWGAGVEAFADKVKLLSDGALDIRVYGAGELVPALGVLDAVSAGRVEMGHAASYYWQGKIPSAVFFTSVPFGLNAAGMRSWISYGGGQELWDEAYKPFGVLAMPAGNTGMQMGGWFKKPINNINDFKGLKMRIPGLGGAVIAKAGAKPMLVAGGEIYTNLSTGVIDATEWVGPYHDYTMGFHKVADYYYTPGWHEPGPVLELMINQKKWNELPKELQQIVRTCAAELDRNMQAEWLAKDAIYLAKIKKETKVKVLSFPADVLSSLRGYAEQSLDELAAHDPLANKIRQSFEAFRSQFAEHLRATEFAYWQSEFDSSKKDG